LRCCLASAWQWVDRSPHAVVTDGELVKCEPEGKWTMRVDLNTDGGVIRWRDSADEKGAS
jgi:hypothetical protein